MNVLKSFERVITKNKKVNFCETRCTTTTTTAAAAADVDDDDVLF